jgi:methylthioribulose-1-phosphate dehydratase
MVALNDFDEKIRSLSGIVRGFYDRGWVLGTGGNFSVVLEKDPLRVAITATGIDKGVLSSEEILQIDADGSVLQGTGQTSEECGLHLAVIQALNAAAVFHTHSVWSTVVSMAYAEKKGLTITGLEMLKGLRGVSTHEHKEWLPIISNSQDIPFLSQEVWQLLIAAPESHGFLVRGHGLYAWGEDLFEAKRHTEIFEFLLEVVGRTYS